MPSILYEDEGREEERDPNEIPLSERRLVTQPYDLVVTSVLDQIDRNMLFLKPLSNRPSFQRNYVWPNKLASRLIESILLNVPIPPCYFSQNSDSEYDVIDGQQRIYSIFRFVKNQLKLTGLEILTELNGLEFYQLKEKDRRKIETHTLRCVVITNDSDPDIRFDVFERLNTNTVPLNAQELRNCVNRGTLIDLLGKLAEYKPWLAILNRPTPDRRMRDDELILRFFAFQIQGIEKYKTPQKVWLNEVARNGRKYQAETIAMLEATWKGTIDNCLTVFDPDDCFRRLPREVPKRTVINRALMDLTMYSLAGVPQEHVERVAGIFKERYMSILLDDEFNDLITRAIDHKSRTTRRFEIWKERVLRDLI